MKIEEMKIEKQQLLQVTLSEVPAAVKEFAIKRVQQFNSLILATEIYDSLEGDAIGLTMQVDDNDHCHDYDKIDADSLVAINTVSCKISEVVNDLDELIYEIEKDLGSFMCEADFYDPNSWRVK